MDDELLAAMVRSNDLKARFDMLGMQPVKRDKIERAYQDILYEEAKQNWLEAAMTVAALFKKKRDANTAPQT
jgi:hypothetical protein